MTQLDGPFGELSQFLDIPRVSGLALSPDGATLVAGVQQLSPDGKKFVSALWRIDPAGGPAVRLTRSAEGESAAAFLPNGDLLFSAKRADPAKKKDDPEADGAALWSLPKDGGEARLLAAPPAGVGAFAVARDAGTVVLAVQVLPGAADLAEDAKRRKARKDGDVTAILHEQAQIRFWDHQIGPDAPRLFALTPPAAGDEARPELREVTGDVGFELAEGHDVTPDGAAVIATFAEQLPDGVTRTRLVKIGTDTGERATFVEDEEWEYFHPAVSPDGRWVVTRRELMARPDRPYRVALWLLPADGGEGSDPLEGQLDVWPDRPVWSKDSNSFYFTADQTGAAPVFRYDLGSGAVTRLTGDHGTYSSVCVTPDGATVYALRAAVDAAPQPVRLDARAADQTPTMLDAPGAGLELPGRFEEVVATADDGQQIHGRLILPARTADGQDGPAPLLTFIHGGPHASNNGWNWRWSPWVFASRGYAVLMPDPGLSTGYGQDFVARGWGEWGAEPYTDLMTIIDAVVKRPDIDETRTAALGGSFGGYMANWVATHTDRFKAIVSHAGLWALELKATSDAAHFFRRQFGHIVEEPERWVRNSPHRSAADVRTPMLVIHGNKDYRVPIGNALWQWYDLSRLGADAKFLYYPDENHWILKPQASAVWYETVLAFLAQKVLGEEWQKPDLL